MNPYIEKLNTHFEEHTEEDAGSLLELLCYFYTVANSIDNDTVRTRFKELEDLLKGLTVPENDRVSDLLCDICMEYIHIAFLEGIHVGFRLNKELAAPKE